MDFNSSRTPRLLIVDDEPGIVSVLYSLLSDQYDCQTARNAGEALDLLKRESFELVMSDIMMPGMSGLELLEEITTSHQDSVVIMISGNLNIQSAIEAMRRGAFDYVTKPFNLSDVETSVERALRHQGLVRANRLYEQHLQELVSLRTQELSHANSSLNATLEKLYVNYRATLRALAATLEARDIETGGHSERVVTYCMKLGRLLGLAGHELVTLEQGALLHDIGKIGIPDRILLKRGALTQEEWQHMRRHVEYGAQILRGIEFLRGASQIVAQHHERFDGSGYPNKLRGEQICLGARIFAVADAVDAITSDRPYRAGQSFEVAAEELSKCAGEHFDPRIVRAFLSLRLDEWREIRDIAAAPPPSPEDLSREVSYSALALIGERFIKEANG